MSHSIVVTHFTSPGKPQDADLFRRIAIAFATNERVGWREIHVIVRDGLVTLWSRVPNFDNRRLVVALARHVAGVLRVNDELTVSDSPAGESQANVAASDSTLGPRPLADRESAETVPNLFRHLPVTDSLDERVDNVPEFARTL